MNFSRSTLLLGCLLGLAGCKAGPPRLQLECIYDQDCQLTSVGPDCCDACGSSVGNAGSIAAHARYCAEHRPAACPRLDCPNTSSTAFCGQGRCQQRAGIHN